MTDGRVYYVKVAAEIADQLDKGWSEPVQLLVVRGEDEDGRKMLNLTVRTMAGIQTNDR